MTGPVKIRMKRPPAFEAVRLEADTTQPAPDALDPNTQSHAVLAGWLMGHGFRDFKVTPMWDSPAFGVFITGTSQGPTLARPGWWILRGLDGDFSVCDPAVFDAMYEVES
jgi:hypothetical protein